MTDNDAVGLPTASIALPAGVTDSLLAQALETVSEGSLITDAERLTIYANSAFTEITGYNADDAMGKNCRFLQGPDTSPEEVQRIRDALTNGEVFQGTILNYRKDGSSFWNHLTITPLHDDDGHITNFVSVQRDVTDIVEERERLSYEASHDPLTGLPNREGSRRLVRRALEMAAERGDAVAIGVFDLDSFKQLNDTHGHPAGDAALVELGRRVSGALRRGDHVTRVGGDEFVVVLSGLDPARVHDQLDDVLRRIRRSVVAPLVLESGAEVSLSGSMGVAVFPTDGVDAKALYAAADRALFRAKERRGSSEWFEVATPRPRQHRGAARASAASEASMAPLGGSPQDVGGVLTMYMQPIVELRTGRVTQMEALARLVMPDGSISMPDQFLPRFSHEQLRYLFWLGLHQSLDWVSRWEEQGLELNVSVNMPPELLAAPESVQFVVDALEGARVDPSRLCLELLETRDLELASTDKAVGELTELGVKVHLDDIGSGYSTLQRVADLPFEVIKVDRHIFDSVRTRPLQVITVLSAIIKLGADFDYGVTVEGVETQERLEVSTALGARFGQGYLFARPMPAADVLEWARQFAPPTPFGTVTTPLGALAYQWVCTRTPEVQHPSREQCPLTAYCDGVTADGAALHDKVHEGGEAGSQAGTLLMSWLMDEASSRH